MRIQHNHNIEHLLILPMYGNFGSGKQLFSHKNLLKFDSNVQLLLGFIYFFMKPFKMEVQFMSLVFFNQLCRVLIQSVVTHCHWTHWQHNTLEEIIGLRVCEATHSCCERSFYRSASAMKSCCTFTDTVGKLLSMAYTLSSSVTSDSELGIYF